MLVHIEDIISKAQAGDYAIGAFNTQNLEITLGIIRGAVAQHSPIIIQISETTIKYASLKAITHVVTTLAKNESTNVPIALHLDHGSNFLSVTECISAGFSSIHIDGSKLPFDENVNLTKQSVEYAHDRNTWAQGEVGTILGKEGLVKKEKNLIKPDEYMTDPEQAADFVQRTNVDTLAVSIGNMHGIFAGQEHLDLKRLKAIREKVKLPLVLHGASGVDAKEVAEAIKLGVKIINIDTDLRWAFTNSLRQTLQANPTETDPRQILSPSIDAIQELVEKHVKIFGSAGKS
ncbi:hypothetical protein A3I35_00325 [Candidatus Falkowbacteria bacterium RIFCSPLOWO2_02_FULL_45_15]|uniref:Tagatose-bisphosphate aldolase n=2 Tax=Candidatus Falkowiibacteriota TaxID=1752728 RepID=A0A1F5RZ80_9BACT|nr:MAG: hypothetical protein A3I35_00325 [Candidatus Falkowbacteria bacterium RIFCSPLOWO2_02_FULL_45_15]OGF19705.1 MAG: hypothetical protein A3D54_02245 [Candidatus Falkowbacteria bacterium RIFCSPHIGHO2_02_FULL_45_15]